MQPESGPLVSIRIRWGSGNLSPFFAPNLLLGHQSICFCMPQHALSCFHQNVFFQHGPCPTILRRQWHDSVMLHNCLQACGRMVKPNITLPAPDHQGQLIYFRFMETTRHWDSLLRFAEDGGHDKIAITKVWMLIEVVSCFTLFPQSNWAPRLNVTMV